MKRVGLILFILCIASFVFAQDAGDDPTNAFASLGDCEAKIWVEPTVSCTVVLDDVQYTSPGSVGNCCAVAVPPAWARPQGSTADVATGALVNGTDAVLEFYYKITGTPFGGPPPSYPYIYFRQDITDNSASIHPSGGASKVVYWGSATATGVGGELLIVDGAWHQFTPNITDFDWSGQTADLGINCLSASGLTSDLWVDEIYLTDPTPPASGVEDWGLY